MTMEEEQGSLEKAYKRIMGESDTEEMISNEFKRRMSYGVIKR